MFGNKMIFSNDFQPIEKMGTTLKMDEHSFFNSFIRIHQGWPYLVIIGWLIFQQRKDHEDIKIDVLENKKIVDRMNRIKTRKTKGNFFSALPPIKARMIKDQEAFINILYDTYRIPYENIC